MLTIQGMEETTHLHDGGRVKPTKVVRPMLMSFRSLHRKSEYFIDEYNREWRIE
jgi:hypothetical protein